MQIQVRSVYEVRKELLVRFTCELGQGDARWTGRIPTPDTTYNVEIDIPAPLRWGASIREALETEPIIATTIDGNRLVARLQSADPGGDAVLRFGPATILTEAGGEPVQPGSWVQVRTANLVLYPY